MLESASWNHARWFVFLALLFMQPTNISQLAHVCNIYMYTHFSFVSAVKEQIYPVSTGILSPIESTCASACLQKKKDVRSDASRLTLKKGRKRQEKSLYARRLTRVDLLLFATGWLTNIYRAQLCTPLTGDIARSWKVQIIFLHYLRYQLHRIELTCMRKIVDSCKVLRVNLYFIVFCAVVILKHLFPARVVTKNICLRIVS